TFSFSEDIISQQFNYEKSTNVHYSKPLKAVRYDFEANKITNPLLTEGPYKAIHDFTSGVGFAINEDNKNCLLYPIGTFSIARSDIFPVQTGNEALIQLTEPNQFFYLDDTYFYAGQRYERDILCDVFVSKRTDIPILNKTGTPVLVEFYFQNSIANYDQGLDKLEEVVPISVHVTIENPNLKLINHIYNFDSGSYNRRFDISECFYGKDKALFNMKFKIPEGLDRNEFMNRFERPVLEQFEETIKKSLKGLEYSPLRIVSPRIKVENSNFIISSGVTGTAESILHFRKVNDSRIDQSKVRYKVQADSSKKCANACLKKTEIQTLTGDPDFICRSFDYCPDSSSSNGYFCSFYDLTVSDPGITLESAPACEHYSKSTKDFDIATVDQLYGSVKEAVLRKEFKFDIETKQKKIYTFEPEDIFDQTEGQNTGTTGSTSYFGRFDLLFRDTDFQQSYFSSNPSIISRKKSMVSVDECARLCIFEPTFNCESFTFNDQTKECKWANLLLLTQNITVSLSSIEAVNGSSLFIRDPLYDYIEFPFKVTALVDYSLSNVISPSECAFKCNTEKNCRSFNLCKKDDETYRCLLSDSNVHNTEKDPNVVYSAICSHYSIRAINNFEEVVQTQLSIKPQSNILNQSIEGCAEICSFQDGYLCRSFDYDIEKKECYLYRENLVDKNFLDLGIKSNKNVNHYS
ncbi:antigen B membrane, partial [Brachionus plicatilis]